MILGPNSKGRRMEDRSIRRVLLSLGFLAASAAAQAQITVGAHLYTFHTNKDMHDDTPGVYAVWPVGVAGGKLITGVYRNSLNDEGERRRVSVYAGQVWAHGRYSLTAALATGYQRKKAYDMQFCPKDGAEYVKCWKTVGFVNSRLAPLVAPSATFPEARQYLGGLTPRLTLLAGKHSAAVHLSLEARL